MTKTAFPRSPALVGLIVLIGLVLQACANGPAPTPEPAARVTPKAAAHRNDGKMAPIPNPPEGAKPPTASLPTRTPVKPAPPKIPPAKQATPAPTVVVATDPAKAAKLRASGLEQLNRGAIDKAVDLLQQALALDPGNVLIQHDLDRAMKISHAVHAKP